MANTRDDVPFFSPGRFYTSAVYKLILAHVLLEYDIKLADEGLKKAPTWTWRSDFVPLASSRLLFRRRA